MQVQGPPIQHPHGVVAKQEGYQQEQLPPDAVQTLYVDGMPLDITKREMAHIFRPFEGYRVSHAGLSNGKPQAMLPKLSETALEACLATELDPEAEIMRTRILLARSGEPVLRQTAQAQFNPLFFKKF